MMEATNMAKKQPSILLVDDNVNLTRSIALILNRKGFNVDTVNNGFEAIDKLKNKTFDIIFMDIKMPIMNGVETFKKIKAINPDAHVMMMTAYSVEELIDEALQEGAHGIIYKPIGIDSVIGLINDSVKNSDGALILVVDDDPGTSKMLKNILTVKGYIVTTCSNGEEAIALSQSNDFDILFIDMKLPTINGLETYLEIKKIKSNAIAIMITGFLQEFEDLLEEAKENSAYTCLYKPLSMKKVLKIIDEILQMRERVLTE